jgi:hypothetical protein
MQGGVGIPVPVLHVMWSVIKTIESFVVGRPTALFCILYFVCINLMKSQYFNHDKITVCFCRCNNGLCNMLHIAYIL